MLSISYGPSVIDILPPVISINLSNPPINAQSTFYEIYSIKSGKSQNIPLWSSSNLNEISLFLSGGYCLTFMRKA